MSRWDNVWPKPSHEPFGPFDVLPQTTGGYIVVDRRIKKPGEWVAGPFRTDEGAVAFARRLADAEGFVGKEWEPT